MTGIIINSILVLFAVAMIYMLLWRLMFLDTNREPAPTAVQEFLTQYSRSGSLEPRGRLGALQQCFDEAGGSASVLRNSLYRFQRRVERFHDSIFVVANAAMGIGFLGTVVSMAGAAGGKVDPVSIIGLGMMSTMYGLIIALPGNMFHGLTNARVMRFLDYIDALLDALDRPISPALVPSPPNGPSTSGQDQKPVRYVESKSDRHAQHAPRNSRLNKGLEPSTAGSRSMTHVVLPADTALNVNQTPSARVDEEILECLTNEGDVQNETTT